MSALQTLVVDDSPTARTVLKRLLERKGLQVDQSESGIQALDYLKSHKPDLIFMDHSMPGMNGLEAIRAIRRDPATASIPVVMYTSQNDEAYFQEALATGAMGVIPKPATWHKLSEVLNSVAQGRLIMTDQIAANIDQQLTSLRDHLSFTMERQIGLIGEELRHDLDQRLLSLESQLKTAPSHPGQALSSLVHSVTDSKLHQLNLELRHHISAKLDVLSQDLSQQQTRLKQEILLEVEQTLHRKLHRRGPRLPRRALRFLGQHWHFLPFCVALSLITALLAYWAA